MRNEYLEEDVQELYRQNFTVIPICTVFIISSPLSLDIRWERYIGLQVAFIN